MGMFYNKRLLEEAGLDPEKVHMGLIGENLEV